METPIDAIEEPGSDKKPTLLMDRVLRSLERWEASDLFLTVGKPPAIRQAGSIVPLQMPPTSREDIEAFLDRSLTLQARKTLEDTGDLDFGYSLADGRRFRFSIYHQQGRLSLVCRALPKGDLSFGDLRLPSVIAQFAGMNRGLVLVTGATGSGKSTTLAALIHHINSHRHAHIVTIEDPIEFVHHDIKSRITQREIGSDTPSFSSALRHAVRQSPDVILIGEMRDAESMQIALSAALTGHLVFATVHTIDTSQTLQRIISYFPPHLVSQVAMDLSMSLRGIISQRLIPRADEKSRVVATELLTCTPAVAQLIREDRSDEIHDLMRSVQDDRIITFNDSLLQLYRDKEITFEVGRAYATNPDEFSLTAQGMSTGVGAFHTDEDLETVTGIDMKALLVIARKRGASDMHITVGRPPICRIGGVLTPLTVPDLTAADMRGLLFSILSAKQRAVYELERELDFALALDEGKRFRVNAYYQKGHMAASLRAIPSKVPDAQTLRLPRIVLELGKRPQGLLLVVGPTGSGKSTTLACLVDQINRERSCRIITVEDPIEYTYDSHLAIIDQREIHSDTKSFAASLKYVLRQDPDVILVGEMRDQETISAAMTAAETGHLVLATLHTNDAIQAIDRIIDIFPSHQQSQARSQLAASLLGVVSQRLLPRGHEPGRVAAFEIMVASPAIRTLIREKKMHQARGVMEASASEGMTTMDESLAELYATGQVLREDALRYTDNPNKIMGGRRSASSRSHSTSPGRGK